MASIVSLLSAPIAVVALSSRHGAHLDPAEEPATTMNSVRRFEHAWRPFGFLGDDLLAWAGVELMLKRHVRTMIRQILGFAHRAFVERVVVVLDCPTAMLLAAPLADELKCPLSVLVWDMPEHVLSGFGHRGLGLRSLLRRFDIAVEAAESVAVMGKRMQDEFQDRYGKPTLILRQPIDDSWRCTEPNSRGCEDDLVIGFAGSVTARDEVEALLDALDSVGWRIGGRRVRFRVFSLRFICQAKTARWIEYRGYVETTAEVVQGLSECELLYLPQPFGQDQRWFAEFSFPTKLTTYLASCRPIVLCAPEYSSLVNYFREIGVADVCTDRSGERLLGLLNSLVASPDRQRALATKLARAAERDFSVPLCRERLREWLCRASGDLGDVGSQADVGTPMGQRD